MTKKETLADLVEIKKILQEEIIEIDKEIDRQQIIRATDLTLFGFKVLTKGAKYTVYSKSIDKNLVYEVVLDITNPNKVIICKKFDNQTSQFNFVLENLKAFVTLLMQLEII